MLKETKEDIVEPLEIREDELLMVHTQEYLNSLKVSSPTPPLCRLYRGKNICEVVINFSDA